VEQAQTYIYEFDDFRVDPGRRLLLGRDGRPLPLRPKALDTLIYLVQHTDEVLAKETLIRAIWADTVVEENNLNQCISALRRVFGEKRAENRYIVTVPGRGYRFVAPVNKRKPPVIASSAESTPSIGVLPFHPLARNNRDGALEMGMADTLIARLGGVPNIVVRPMSSVRKYADLKQNVLAAGRELGVDSVLEGSLQHQGNRVRVNVRPRQRELLWRLLRGCQRSTTRRSEYVSPTCPCECASARVLGTDGL
jgi:DNA-binding winged helix-turn-helix (wHTH) protein